MKYLVGDKPDKCVFCDAISSKDDKENLVVYRGEHAVIMLNLYPYNSGHLMVIPLAHVESLEGLDAATQLEVMELVSRSLTALRKLYSPDGFNIGVNIGSAAGAGICEHVHIHVVPRWDGDTNFMPVFASTRVVPEMLNVTYDKLKAELENG
jgi:ATP adenylyltransferase